MKKIITLILACVLVAGMSFAAAGSAGTAADPFVSKSYIIDTYESGIINSGESKISNQLENEYSSAIFLAQRTRDMLIEEAGIATGYLYAPSGTVIGLDEGDTVYLQSGASLVMEDGVITVRVVAGEVYNVSTADEILTGGSLTASQRYFCMENTTVIYKAQAPSAVVIDGYYKTTGTVNSKPDSIGAPDGLSFTDVKSNSWYYNAVKYVYDRNFANGYPNGTFGVSRNVTRAEFVYMLYALGGTVKSSIESPFSDVKSSDWYYNAVMWAAEYGVVGGYPNGTFKPNNKITRQDIAVILYNFYKNYLGENVSNVSNVSGDVYSQFSDTGKVASYAVNALKWATEGGVVAGSSGKINPTSNALRVEAVQMICNFCTEFLDA